MYAAEGGHLEVLQWARANGCPWDADTCVAAVDEQRHDVFLWARENDCPMNDNTRLLAIEFGWLGDDDDL